MAKPNAAPSRQSYCQFGCFNAAIRAGVIPRASVYSFETCECIPPRVVLN
jgi:hypothetical protein